jgi:hypothetical protein
MTCSTQFTTAALPQDILSISAYLCKIHHLSELPQAPDSSRMMRRRIYWRPSGVQGCHDSAQPTVFFGRYLAQPALLSSSMRFVTPYEWAQLQIYWIVQSYVTTETNVVVKLYIVSDYTYTCNFSFIYYILSLRIVTEQCWARFMGERLGRSPPGASTKQK